MISGEIGSGTVHEFMQVLFQERSWVSMAESGDQLRYRFN